MSISLQIHSTTAKPSERRSPAGWPYDWGLTRRGRFISRCLSASYGCHDRSRNQPDDLPTTYGDRGGDSRVSSIF